MKITVIDGQGGNIGKQLVKRIKESFSDQEVRAIGTNPTAPENMPKDGADEAATGENAAIVANRWADISVGPIGIIIPDALLGEVSPKMAAAIGSSNAQKILIPLNLCDVLIPGTDHKNTGELLDDALKMIRAIIK